MSDDMEEIAYLHFITNPAYEAERGGALCVLHTK